MKKYLVTLKPNEAMEVEADNADEAIDIFYNSLDEAIYHAIETEEITE